MYSLTYASKHALNLPQRVSSRYVGCRHRKPYVFVDLHTKDVGKVMEGRLVQRLNR